jgi:hypothetical protein
MKTSVDNEENEYKREEEIEKEIEIHFVSAVCVRI